MTSIPKDGDLALLNTSCRILTLSSSLPQAASLIHSVQILGLNQTSPIAPETYDENPPVSDTPESPELIKIPWTISNRYYSADVHFAVHTIRGLSPHHFSGVPAVIYVWAAGQPYQEDIELISQDMVGYEPEVCLAIKVLPDLRPTAPSSPEAEDDVEDDADVDTFLSSHGFEYIDVTRTPPPDNDERIKFRSEGIPHFPRVLDALSTIMWPSMQTSSKRNNEGRAGRSHLDWSQSSLDHSLTIVEDVAETSSEQLHDGKGAMKLEMQELVRWLEEDNTLQQDPWQSAASSGAISLSPTATEFDHTTHTKQKIGPSGFDDDFTVFISAPSVEPVGDSGFSTPEMSSRNLSESLAPPHAGDLYRSLGSVSDFGGSDDGKPLEGEEDLPTKEEIKAASARIFGREALPQPATLSRDPTVRPPTREPPPFVESSEMFNAGIDEQGDSSYDMAPFDLSRVLGALQEMKAEIANMNDEGERRKAAAKVALGLVYGLEADKSADP